MDRDLPNPFPEPLRSSARLVEATRDQRLARSRRGEAFPTLSLAERQAWVEDFHPDHQEGGRRELRVGGAAGTVLPVELADLLEAWPHPAVRIGPIPEPDLIADVLILGGGGAGTAAAIAAAEAGAKVVIATKLRQGDSNTLMAEGGIQVADQECDSPVQHFLDILGGGHFSSDPELAQTLAADGPATLQWLEELGMLFDKYPTGRMKIRHGGGTSRKRMHSAGDVTGLELMRVLQDRGAALENITVLPFQPAVELLTDEAGRAAGAVLYHLVQKRLRSVAARATVLATGGLGRLHLRGFPTSNHYGATADGLVLAYRAGLPLRDLQHNQYHPTGIAWPERKVGLLITEKFRGLGAQLLNRHGDEFVHPLEPRDVTTAAIIRECREYANGVATGEGGMGVWLDIPLIDLLHGVGTIEREFPGRFKEFHHKGLDLRVHPLLAYPTLHYQNGGVVIAPDGGTDIPGLLAAGEVTGGTHGRNRLMGNALLEILVFGRRAGRAAAEFAFNTKELGVPSTGHLEVFLEQLATAGVDKSRFAPILLPSYGGNLKPGQAVPGGSPASPRGEPVGRGAPVFEPGAGS
ncbi:MAG: FAD-binding protein [Magnetococcales bacterium]|nr:FAD-binding protein [Magnetococcales bacterium]